MYNFEKFRKHWIWAIVGSFLTIGLGLASYYLQYQSTRHDLGGFLNATFHNRTLNNKDARTIIICVDDTTQLYNNIYFTPTFDNPDEYSLHDFSLNFETTFEGVELIPSSFVKTYQTGDDSFIYKYDQEVLQAHMDTKNPFMGFRLFKDFARCEVVSKVSFDGAANLFEYRTDLWFVYTPNKNNLSFDYWKLNCKQKLFKLVEDKSFDIYYLSKNEAPEYQFDVILSSDNKEKKKESELVENEKPEPNANKELVTIANYSSEDAITNADFDILDYELTPGDNSTLTVFFNRPVSKSGMYVINYKAKDGWWFKNKYSRVDLRKGDKGCALTLFNYTKKITDLEIYHRVNPNSFIEVKKNYDGYLSFLPKSNTAIIGMNYDDGSFYIRELTNGLFNAHFEKPVTIELFDRNHAWWERIFEDEEGLDNDTYLWIYIGLVIISLGMIILGACVNRLESLIPFGLIASILLCALAFIPFCLYLLYFAFKYVINYIYLML